MAAQRMDLELTYEPLDAVYLNGLSLLSRRALPVSNLFGRVAEQNRAFRDGRRLGRLYNYST